jgi:uncharacterized membrane protein YeiB
MWPAGLVHDAGGHDSPEPAPTRPEVTAVGSMSLTAYLGHVIAIGALDLSAAQGEPLPVLLGFIAGSIVFALVWSRFFRRGPLEFPLHEATEPVLRPN